MPPVAWSPTIRATRPAYSGLALVYLRDFYLDIVHPGEAPALDRALQYAQRAVELKPQSARAHDALSVVRFARGEIVPAFLAADRARELNPYDTNTLANYGSRLVAVGEVDRGLAMLNEAAAHTLVRPAWFDSYLFIGAYLAGDRAAASQHAAMIANDGSPIGLIARTVAADMAGDDDRAKQAVAKLVASQSQVADRTAASPREILPIGRYTGPVAERARSRRPRGGRHRRIACGRVNSERAPRAPRRSSPAAGRIENAAASSPPIPQRRLHQGQCRDGGGVGAEDAWAERDGGDERERAETLALVAGEAALRADEDGERRGRERGEDR